MMTLNMPPGFVLADGPNRSRPDAVVFGNFCERELRSGGSDFDNVSFRELVAAVVNPTATPPFGYAVVDVVRVSAGSQVTRPNAKRRVTPMKHDRLVLWKTAKMEQPGNSMGHFTRLMVNPTAKPAIPVCCSSPNPTGTKLMAVGRHRAIFVHFSDESQRKAGAESLAFKKVSGDKIRVETEVQASENLFFTDVHSGGSLLFTKQSESLPSKNLKVR